MDDAECFNNISWLSNARHCQERWPKEIISATFCTVAYANLSNFFQCSHFSFHLTGIIKGSTPPFGMSVR
ncbi:hypothetical protein DR73_536 [Enterobacteriaceae bacterium ATCC 29904]|nr:hypothetical protein DR73_536 [Enterobacteriaceae bacterium ATCC 29904]